MKAKNIQGKSISEIKFCFDEVVQSGFKPTLGIVFCSVIHDREAIADLLTQHNVAVFGCTTAGEILDEEVFEHSIVLMLLDINEAYFKIFFQQGEDTHNIAYRLASFSKEQFKNPSIVVISSGLTVDAEQILAGANAFDSQIPLFGGLAGDDLTMKSSFVFTNKNASNSALLGLILDNDQVNVQGIATSGWDNIGIEKTITKSAGNIVYSIDDEPAADVFVKFFQFAGSVDEKSEIVAMNFAQYPLQLKKDNGNTVLRAPLMVDTESRALIFAGGIPQGSRVKFSVPPGFDLIEKTTERISRLKEKISSPDAVLMFSCKARHLALGPLAEDEASSIRGIWDKPLIGLFTYGEIGTALNGVCDFHNETCSMVVFGEK